MTYGITATRPEKKKKEKILYRLENTVRKNWARKGYWKHSIAMQLSYELGSLADGWRSLNNMISSIKTENDLKKSQNNDLSVEDWNDSISVNPDFNPYKSQYLGKSRIVFD